MYHSDFLWRPCVFWTTQGLPLTRQIDYTLSSLPPSQWAGWKNAVFLWMKLRQRLVSLGVSWLVDRGRIAPHHRNWRQREIGEGIARSPSELSVIQKRSKTEYSGATKEPRFGRRTRYLFLRTGFAIPRTPVLHWQLGLRFQRSLQKIFSWMVAWRTVRFAIFHSFRKSVLCFYLLCQYC